MQNNKRGFDGTKRGKERERERIYTIYTIIVSENERRKKRTST